MSSVQHSWEELDWCMKHADQTQVFFKKSALRNLVFEKCPEERLEGTGYYEFCESQPVYRVYNRLQFGNDKPRYFMPLVRLATVWNFHINQ